MIYMPVEMEESVVKDICEDQLMSREEFERILGGYFFELNIKEKE